MRLVIFTIAHQAMPWLKKHYPVFQKLRCEWEWVIAHGPANNGGSTRWCKPQEPGFSTDGTVEYLDSIANDKRVNICGCELWESKDQQVNACLEFKRTQSPFILMEIDSDEIWTTQQIENVVHFFDKNPHVTSMQFQCSYFVGPDLMLEGEHCYGDMDYEWWRAWRYCPEGLRFFSHEPPILDRQELGYKVFKGEHPITRFDHMAYATEAQVAYKEKFYGYDGLLDGWRRLQEVKDFPVKLSDYFPQVKGELPLVVKVNQ